MREPSEVRAGNTEGVSCEAPRRSIREKDQVGGSCTTLVEPLVVEIDYEAQWTKTALNLGELANLRDKGWSQRDLALHFGCGKTKILKLLQMIENYDHS